MFQKTQKDTLLITWMTRFGAWLVGMIGVVLWTHVGGRESAPSSSASLLDPFLSTLGIWGTSLVLPIGSGILVAAVVWCRTRPWMALTVAGTSLSFWLVIRQVASWRKETKPEELVVVDLLKRKESKN
mmetsp:Transcript_44988/g.108780  ORF Transcript_44988/g.108780 Transcript_44988/m.108780 type:complete len:128 (-) Transcript_44988:45-428(-)